MMARFRGIVFCAALAGLIVGLLVSALQHVSTTRLIQQAEVFEKAAEAGAPDLAPSPLPAQPAAHQHASAPLDTPSAPAAPGHVHDAPAWAPREGLERTFFTVLSNVVTGVGGALILLGLFALRGRPVDWRAGLWWGLAAFVAVLVAPSLGLPPSPPGVPTADLAARQIWWTGTALSTASALALLAFGQRPWMAALALALIVSPHLVGAPQPADVQTAVPAALTHQFMVAATVTSLCFWALLGALSGALYPRFLR